MTYPLSLAEQIDVRDVLALLIGRPPDLLDDPARFALYERTVTGVSSEVASVTGPFPVAQVLQMALWCVALGVAASLESSLFPEQQIGDAARSRELRARFLGVLASLRGALAPGGSSGASDIAGSFSTSECRQ